MLIITPSTLVLFIMIVAAIAIYIGSGKSKKYEAYEIKALKVKKPFSIKQSHFFVPKPMIVNSHFNKKLHSLKIVDSEGSVYKFRDIELDDEFFNDHPALASIIRHVYEEKYRKELI